MIYTYLLLTWRTCTRVVIDAIKASFIVSARTINTVVNVDVTVGWREATDALARVVMWRRLRATRGVILTRHERAGVVGLVVTKAKRTCSSYANTTRGILVHVKYDTSTLDKSNTIFMKNKKKVDKSNYYLITSGTHPVVGAVTAEHVHAVDTHAIVETRWRQTIVDVRLTI